MSTTTVRSPVSIQVAPVYTPPFFSRFNSSAKEILHSHYLANHEFKVKARSKLGIYQEYGIIAASPLEADSKLVGYVTANWAHPSGKFDLDSTYYTDASYGDKLSFTPRSGLPAGSTLELSAYSKAPHSAKVAPAGGIRATFNTNHVAVTTEATTDLVNHTLDASLVLATPHGKNGFSVGGSVLAAANNDGAVTVNTAEAGVHYKTAEWQASLVTTGHLSKLLGSFYQTLNPSTVFAAQFEAPVDGSNNRKLTLGTSHQLDANTSLKVKTSVPSGVVGLHVETAVNTNSTYFRSWLPSSFPRGKLALSLETSGKQGGLGIAHIARYGVGFTAGEYP